MVVANYSNQKEVQGNEKGNQMLKSLQVYRKRSKCKDTCSWTYLSLMWISDSGKAKITLLPGGVDTISLKLP